MIRICQKTYPWAAKTQRYKMKVRAAFFKIPNTSYATSKSDVLVATEYPRRTDNRLDIVINDGKGHSKLISYILPSIFAHGDCLLGTFNA